MYLHFTLDIDVIASETEAMEEFLHKIITREADLSKEPLGVHIYRISDDWTHVEVILEGPRGTPYHGAIPLLLLLLRHT